MPGTLIQDKSHRTPGKFEDIVVGHARHGTHLDVLTVRMAEYPFTADMVIVDTMTVPAPSPASTTPVFITVLPKGVLISTVLVSPADCLGACLLTPQKLLGNNDADGCRMSDCCSNVVLCRKKKKEKHTHISASVTWIWLVLHLNCVTPGERRRL